MASVLVVDDVEAMRESLRAALAGAGHQVAVAASGAEALDVLRDRPVDIAVTDIWMPDIDGLKLIKKLREEFPRLRIVAMTGGGPRLTIETAGSLAEVWGAERVFVKPFDEDLLIRLIDGGQIAAAP